MTVCRANRKIPYRLDQQDHWVERRNSPGFVERPVRVVRQKHAANKEHLFFSRTGKKGVM